MIYETNKELKKIREKIKKKADIIKKNSKEKFKV